MQIILLFSELFLCCKYIHGLSLLSWGSFCASSLAIVMPFHCQKQLLNPSSCPVPDIKITGCLFRDYLQNRFCLSYSRLVKSVCFLLLPKFFLLPKPRFEVFSHRKVVMPHIRNVVHMDFVGTRRLHKFLSLRQHKLFFAGTLGSNVLRSWFKV